MSSSPENLNSSLSRGTRRAASRRRLRSRAGPRACRAPRRFNNGGRGKRSRCSKAVSAKLESLKNLINPSSQGEKAIKAEELFQETADYIVLLRTQVVILQRLVEFYGSSDTENTAATTVL